MIPSLLYVILGLALILVNQAPIEARRQVSLRSGVEWFSDSDIQISKRRNLKKRNKYRGGSHYDDDDDDEEEDSSGVSAALIIIIVIVCVGICIAAFAYRFYNDTLEQ